MKVRSLNHLALHVKDAVRSAEFYREFCGMETIHSRMEDGEAARWVRLPSQPDSFMLILQEMLGELTDEPGNMDHLGFYVETRKDVDEIAARAKGLGILLDGPVYAEVVGYYCMLQDPDGYILEFSCEHLQA